MERKLIEKVPINTSFVGTFYLTEGTLLQPKKMTGHIISIAEGGYYVWVTHESWVDPVRRVYPEPPVSLDYLVL